MASAWITLSTSWSLTSVQAALNVIISVLSTIGIWSFSRYWWRRGSSKIIRNKRDVRLSALFTFTGPGEAWDLVAILRTHVFAKENWHLLVQLLVVVSVTLACMFSGPIAKVSLKAGKTARLRELQVLQTMKGGGSFGNLIDGNVPWNNTIQSLDRAGFPTNQLLDYVPPSTKPWTYIAKEWDPTWTVVCIETPETTLSSVTGSGVYNIYEPINAFPAFRDTYDPSWLNASSFRIESNFLSWSSLTDTRILFTDAIFLVLIQSDPDVDDRMDTNNDKLRISISAFYARGFQATYSDPGNSLAAEYTWLPIGPVGNVSYTRTECNITRKPEVADEDMIPWVWTNDTWSIADAYVTYWTYPLEESAGRNLSFPMPTAKDLLRFYQAYMATVNTNHSLPSLRKVSIWLQTVEISVIFLTFVVLLSILTIWSTGRYFIFLGRYKSKLEKTYVPDGKMEWMIHAAKSSVTDAETELSEGIKLKDRDHFRTAIFGHPGSDLPSSDVGLQVPGLARVYTNRGSISGTSPTTKRSVSKDISACPSTIVERSDVEDAHGLNTRRAVGPKSESEIVVSSPARESPQISPLDLCTNTNEKMLPLEAPSDRTRSSSEHGRQSPVQSAGDRESQS